MNKLEACPWKLRTAAGTLEPLMGITKEPVEITFDNKAGESTSIAVRVTVVDGPTYDLVLGNEATFPIGACIDSWTEQLFFRPDWAEGGRKVAGIPLDLWRGGQGGVTSGIPVYGGSLVYDPEEGPEEGPSLPPSVERIPEPTEVPACSGTLVYAPDFSELLEIPEEDYLDSFTAATFEDGKPAIQDAWVRGILHGVTHDVEAARGHEQPLPHRPAVPADETFEPLFVPPRNLNRNLNRSRAIHLFEPFWWHLHRTCHSAGTRVQRSHVHLL